MDLEADVRNILSGVIHAQQAGKYLLEESEQVAPVVRRVVEYLNQGKINSKPPQQPLQQPQPQQQQQQQQQPPPSPHVRFAQTDAPVLQQSIETITLPSQ